MFCTFGPFVSNMLLLWTFVDKFVVKAFGNGIPFSNAFLWWFGPLCSTCFGHFGWRTGGFIVPVCGQVSAGTFVLRMWCTSGLVIEAMFCFCFPFCTFCVVCDWRHVFGNLSNDLPIHFWAWSCNCCNALLLWFGPLCSTYFVHFGWRTGGLYQTSVKHVFSKNVLFDIARLRVLKQIY